MALQDVMRVDNGKVIRGAGGGSKIFQKTIEEWNALTTEEKKQYDHASIPNSIGGDITFPANKVIMTGGGNVEDALEELTAKFVMQTYTLRYESATNMRVTGITPPTGCSLERMIILPPNYDSVTVKVTNFLRISTSGIIALGSNFATTDIISLSVLYFKN